MQSGHGRAVVVTHQAAMADQVSLGAARHSLYWCLQGWWQCARL